MLPKTGQNGGLGEIKLVLKEVIRTDDLNVVPRQRFRGEVAGVRCDNERGPTPNSCCRYVAVLGIVGHRGYEMLKPGHSRVGEC